MVLNLKWSSGDCHVGISHRLELLDPGLERDAVEACEEVLEQADDPHRISPVRPGGKGGDVSEEDSRLRIVLRDALLAMLEPCRNGSRDRVHEELIRAGLRRTATQICEPQQHEHDRERKDDIHRPAEHAEGVRAFPEGVARPWVEHDHDEHADQKRREPGERSAGTQRQDRVGGHEERPYQPRAGSGDSPTDDVGRWHENGAGGDQADEVSVETVGRRQHHEIADAEGGEPDREQIAGRLTLGLDR